MQYLIMIDLDCLVKDVMTRGRVEVIKKSPNMSTNNTIYILYLNI